MNFSTTCIHALVIRLGLLLTATLLLTSQNLQAQQYGESGHYYYSTDGTSITILSYNGPGGNLQIPSTLAGLPVRALQGASVFWFVQTPLTSVTIPNGVTSIQGFRGSRQLTSVTIPGSVTSIGYGTFENCSKLTGISIPNSVTSIGGAAFSGCTSLVGITIPNGITRISESTFSGCTSLASVNLPNSITTIDYGAFSGCSTLVGITIPGSVTSIGANTFYGCTSLAGITIPSSVTSIGVSAFSMCTSLAAITIPNSVTSIGIRAFSYCSGLASVTLGNGISTIPSYMFEYCSNLSQVVIPAGVTSIGYRSFYSCNNLSSIEIPDGVTSIGSNAFSYCTSLASVIIPGTVTLIGDRAFEGCTSLATLMVPSNVTSMGIRTFSGCTSLANVVVADGVVDIGIGSFWGCSSLSEVSLPDSLTSIGNSAFENCVSLIQLTIPESVTSIGIQAFSGCTGLGNIMIPDGVTSIGYRTFYQCIALNEITLGIAVGVIGQQAFDGCVSLANVILPANLTSLGSSAFYNCSSLSKATFLGNAPSAYTSSFYNTASGFTVYFYQARSGFTTPTWYGYPTIALAGDPDLPWPVITSPPVLEGVFGQALHYQITATNNPSSYSASGLPSGLSVNDFTGVISGIPTEIGAFMVDLGATNGGGTGQAVLELVVTLPSMMQVRVSGPDGSELQQGASVTWPDPVAVNAELSRPFSILSDSTGTLENIAVSVIPVQGSGFAVDASSVPMSLAPSELAGFSVTLNPPAAGAVQALLRITSNDPDEGSFNVTLVGEGAEAIDVFGTVVGTSGLTGDNALPEATPFGDDVPNLLKYAFNMNLAGPDSSTMAAGGVSGLPAHALDESGPETVWKVEFVRRKGSGLIYTPIKSTDLDVFEPMTGTTTATDIDEKWERVVVTEPCDPAVTPKCFSRVMVELP